MLYELHVRDFSIDGHAACRPRTAASSRRSTSRARAGRQHLQQLAAGGPDARAHPAGVRLRDREGEPGRPGQPRRHSREAVRDEHGGGEPCATDAGKTIRQAMQDAVAANQLDRPAADHRLDARPRRLQLGLRPAALRRARGQLLDATPNGEARILEFRRMVKGLNDIGLRTVMDVVYNHTNALGTEPARDARPPRAGLLPPARRQDAATSSRTPAATTRRPSSR